ncbi:MAG: glycosyl hydrolase family 3, partial [Bacteroidetes bacterium]|nr:glycosyl hydrolase family 3 [Bacteroidota bacterium]
MNKIKKLVVLSLTLLSVPLFAQPKGAVYLDDKKPIEERIEDALSRMTLEEKVAMCHA